MAFEEQYMVRCTPPEAEIQYYLYKMSSVVMSIDHHDRENSGTNVVFPDIVISVSSHFSQPLPEEEVNGMLRYFGFDTAEPVKRRTVLHPQDPAAGNTEYYIQQMPMRLIKKSFLREYHAYCRETGRKCDNRFDAWMTAPSARTRAIAKKLRAAGIILSGETEHQMPVGIL